MHNRSLAVLVASAATLGATATPATARPSMRCAELTALVRGAGWYDLPGRATRCGHLTGRRWFVEGRDWHIRLTVRGRPGARFAADVVYRDV